EPALPLEVGEQQHRRHDGAEAQEGQPERRVAQLEQERAEGDQHGRPPRPGGHSSTSRPSSAERYTASSTRWRAMWSCGGGTLTSPLMTARKYVHSARYDWAKGVSRPLAPVGVASMIVPCTSLNTSSGWTLAEPLVPTRSNQNRSASPMWRQLTSIMSDTPFSHTTSAAAISSTPSFVWPIAWAETRFGAGQPASHSPRSSSCSPRSRNAPPPASWRRRRQPTMWRLG